MRDCYICNIELSSNNCYLSDLRRGGYICKSCRNINYKKHITTDKQRMYSKVKNIKLKEDILQEYGSVCVCCGESGWAFLSIDHIDGNGAQHRKKFGLSGGTHTYQWLKKNHYPKDNFRTLCMNCNACIGFHGFCAHKIKQSKSNLCIDCGANLESGRFGNRFGLYKEYTLPICKICTIFRKDKDCKITQAKKDEKAKALNLRLKLIRGYGRKCICCKENGPLFLTIDHINNDGAKERKIFNNNMYKFYRHLINNKFPTDNYQLLCYNCNCSKGFYGQCFHNMPNEYKDISMYQEIIKGNYNE